MTSFLSSVSGAIGSYITQMIWNTPEGVVGLIKQLDETVRVRNQHV